MAALHVVNPRILVTGGSGQVGWELKQQLSPLGEVFAPLRVELDLASPESIRGAVRSFKPSWIINPAAYTAVDKAESEPELAYAINRDAVAVLAEEAKALGACMVHYSTDYVFDGTSPIAYVETDATNPLGVYGNSKLAGEQALAASGVAHLIFRTSWVYGPRGKNFLLTILKLARERDELRIVNDQHGAPTWCGDLARITAEAISKIAQGAIAYGVDTNSQAKESAAKAVRSLPEVLGPLSGTYHVCSSGETTWYGFAAEAIRQLKELEAIPQSQASNTGASPYARLVPITTQDYPTPARRPANSLLNCSKLKEVFRTNMPEWKLSLRYVLEEQAGSVSRRLQP